MRTLSFFGLLLCLISCEGLTNKELRTQRLVNEEMQNINWNAVDQYPLFNTCQETEAKPEQRKCFEETLLHHFSITVQQFEFNLDSSIKKDLFIDFLVDHKGQIQILEIGKDPKINDQMPEFDGIITRSLRSLPPLAPALKRGIPVSAKFRIPVELETK